MRKIIILFLLLAIVCACRESPLEYKVVETEYGMRIHSDDFSVFISPSAGHSVRDKVVFEAEEVPAGTDFLWLMMAPSDVIFSKDMTEEDAARVLREGDSVGKDDWQVSLDTKRLVNGRYNILLSAGGLEMKSFLVINN